MKTNTTQNNLVLLLKFIAKTAILGSLVLVANAGSNRCTNNIVKSSVYFVPHVRDYCKTPEPCKAFKKEVKLQGSGTLPGNKLLTYSGKTINLGDCDTAFGASGKCLIPFISIAADPKFYRMGDVIEIPSMKGKKITMPNGSTMTHPGYFIVHDTGGAIKGENRFDFFTGSFQYTDPENAFGLKAASDMKMTDVSDCSDRKQFAILRRSDAAYNTIVASIENAVSGSSKGTMVASGKKGSGVQ